MYIDKSLWHTCQICECDIKSIAKEYGGSGIYYTDVFKKHLLEQHSISLEEYFAKYTDRPKCQCKQCGQDVDISKRGANFNWKTYKCGLNEGVKRWSKQAKNTRKGKNNPMYGKEPWNYGLSKDVNESLMTVSKKLTNRTISEQTKKKQSISAKKRKIHGHTGMKHTEASKEKMRKATLARIARGDFDHLRSLPHIKICDLLDSLNIEYEEEKVVDIWSFDIYLPTLDIYIEVDGDYFHSNPKFFSKPESATQKINAQRDIVKNQFCIDNNMTLKRYWEFDILNNEDKIRCELEKLNQ